jgi:hypothetical protein
LEIQQRFLAGSANAVIGYIFIKILQHVAVAANNIKCMKKGSNALSVIVIVSLKYITTAILILTSKKDLIIPMAMS